MTDLPAPLPTLMQLAARQGERDLRALVRRSPYAILPRGVFTTLDAVTLAEIRRRYALHGVGEAVGVVEERVYCLTRGRASSRAEVDLLREWMVDVLAHDGGLVREAASRGWLGFAPLGPVPVVDVVEVAARAIVEPGDAPVDTAPAAA